MPTNPCPEFKDLLDDPIEREVESFDEEGERNVCLIFWVESFQAMDIWL
jgi:hypothetical protein